MIEFRISQPLA